MTAGRNELPIDPTPLEHEAYGWVVRFISGGAGPNDLKALKEWSARSPAHAAAFDQASRTWAAVGPARQSLSATNTSVIRLVGTKKASVSARSKMARRAFLGGALAASAAGAAFMVARPPLELWPSWAELAADYRTAAGEQRQIMLADSVSIDMNTRTSIALRSSEDKPGRIELIAGEAMVSMSGTSSAVTVLAADGRIIATNARFNVRYGDRDVYVTCLEGNIQVERQVAVLPLPAGRQVVYSAQGIGVPITIDSATVMAWKDGVVIFDATPISDVIAEVNRYRRGRIVLTNSGLGRERLNARFRIENIDRVVSQIEQVFGARATTLPGGITLLG
jgi:transmembrane sensor